jgi:hypothetical protein
LNLNVLNTEILFITMNGSKKKSNIYFCSKYAQAEKFSISDEKT